MGIAQWRVDKISKSNGRKDFVELLAQGQQVGMGGRRHVEKRQINKWQSSERCCHFER